MSNNEQTFITSRTGETSCDGINVGRLPDNWHRVQVSRYVGVGHIWTHRLNHLAGFGSRLLTALVLFSGLSVLFASFGAAYLFKPASEAQPPSFVEKLVTAPITYLMGDYPSVNDEKRPTISIPVIDWRPKGKMTVEEVMQGGWATKTSDIEPAIKQELESLAKTGKLESAIPSMPLPDLAKGGWTPPVVEQAVPAGVDPAGNPTAGGVTQSGGKPDTLMYVKAGDDTYFVFTVLVAESSGRPQFIPWSGVFRKHSKEGWIYRDLTLPGVSSYRVKGYEAVSPNQIATTFAQAFPQYVIKQQAQPVAQQKGASR